MPPETTSLQRIERMMEHLLIQLLGSVDGDTEHGRLPRVEAEVAEHDKRLRSLENIYVRGTGVTLAIVVGYELFKTWFHK
ncbi:hypothetical protein [Terriglobus sp. ADX1]|uniref:hypothetical protein n=1 Tax=Terriglobus sp. ADX1 TaxID=2794063 RepID=UPI002FE6B3E8